ncbi:hypothetical protein CBER1_01919 [Cercospora berteroae]|uniref:Phosphodiest-domain-containing protein n=1 Tax=Cercospora berteroae TaxID=357750 RepID=A0A2S6BQ05_9PEZI|nr:hypothetical protein CBER1_01919 [Cercospora berteroae]
MATHERTSYESDTDSVDVDAAQYDQETLTAEEEVERLLADSGKSQHDGRRSKRRSGQRVWRGSRGGEESEMMLKVEDGARSSDDSASASDVDTGNEKWRRSSLQRSKYIQCSALHVIVLLAFVAFAYGAYQASRSLAISKSSSVPQMRSNGTHDFAPTTILISLDGFRADFLHRGLTPTLSSFVQQGVSPKYMMPSFPSLTFPNHFTLVTGKYPSEHGIVGNNFWDPVMRKQFTYTNSSLSMVPEYWNAEPIWETAELQGVRAAIHMWPGSEAHIGAVEPAYVDKFNMHEELGNKVNRILGWLDLPGPSDTGASNETPRPQLIAAYVPNVDSDGHKYGPNSTYIRSTIAEVDGMLGSLFSGIEDRNLTDIINVVVVSDHGMATTSTTRLIQLDDIVDLKEIEHMDGWPLYGLRPFDQSEKKLKELYNGLKKQEALHEGKFKVYLRDHDMPDRYHFTNNQRIAPLWIVPEAGWAIAPKSEFDVVEGLKNGEVFAPLGLHGYDNDHPLMRAIFVARGPAFPHPEGSEVEPFYNTAVYGIICQSLGIEAKPNNGTIELPFQTIGLHDPEGQYEVLDDPPPPIKTTGSSGSPSPSAMPEPPKEDATTANGEDQEATAPGNTEESGEETSKNSGDESTSWRQWVDGKIDSFKHWVTGIFGEHKKISESTKDTSSVR